MLVTIDLNSTISLAQCTPGDGGARFRTRLAGLKRRRTHGKLFSVSNVLERRLINLLLSINVISIFGGVMFRR